MAPRGGGRGQGLVIPSSHLRFHRLVRGGRVLGVPLGPSDCGSAFSMSLPWALGPVFGSCALQKWEVGGCRDPSLVGDPIDAHLTSCDPHKPTTNLHSPSTHLRGRDSVMWPEREGGRGESLSLPGLRGDADFLGLAGRVLFSYRRTDGDGTSFELCEAEEMIYVGSFFSPKQPFFSLCPSPISSGLANAAVKTGDTFALVYTQAGL